MKVEQLTHDLESPLGALKLIASTSTLDAESKEILEATIERLEKILERIRREGVHS